MVTVSGATAADWTDIDVCNFLGDDVASIYRILNEVYALWTAKVTNGEDPPTDILEGLMFGNADDKFKFRIRVNPATGNFEIDINTGSDATPVWSNVGSFTSAGLDHGTLPGLGDDDHTQYSLADGTRAYTSTVAGVTPTSGAHLTTKGYVDSRTTLVSTDASKLTVTSGSSETTLDPSTLPLTADVILRDGTQAFTGDQSLGGENLTNVGEITAVTGTYTTDLTLAGQTVLTDIDLFSAVSSGTEVAYFTNATNLTITHVLNSMDIVAQVLDNTSQLIQPNVQKALTASTFYVEFASPTTGRVILIAATQRVLGAGNLAFIHTQTSPSTAWTINHKLATETPVVEVYDPSNSGISADYITADDALNLTLGFNTAASGTAIILKVGTAVSLDNAGIITDHGDLSGLGDDDHIIYLKADGTRALTGNIAHGSNDITDVGTLATNLITNTTSVTTDSLSSDTAVIDTSLTVPDADITTITGTTLRVGGAASGQSGTFGTGTFNTGTFSTGLTVSGISVMHEGVTRVTASGLNAAQNVVDFVGSGAANVSLAGGTLTVNAPTFTSADFGLFNVVEDTTPQLGGGLDANGFDITAAGENLQVTAGSVLTLDAGTTMTVSAATTITLDGDSEDATIGGSTDRVSNKNVAKAVASWSSKSGTVIVHTAHNFNIASITRTASGQYRITFTKAFVDANYGFTASCEPWVAGNIAVVNENLFASGRQTGTFDVITYSSGIIRDSDKITVVCWGDLAS